MKRLNTIVLILFASVAFGQVNANKDLESRSIIVSAYFSGKSCNYKALKIINEEAQLDTCFNHKDNRFSANKIESVNSLEFYSLLKGFPISKWTQVQNDLDTITRCDFAVPFEVQVFENGKTFKFSLKQFSNCYPISTRLIMEAMEKYFSKLK